MHKLSGMRAELEKIAGKVPLLGMGVGAGLGAGAGALYGNLSDAPEGEQKTWKDYAAPVAVGVLGGAAVGGGLQYLDRKVQEHLYPPSAPSAPSPYGLDDLRTLRHKAELDEVDAALKRVRSAGIVVPPVVISQPQRSKRLEETIARMRERVDRLKATEESGSPPGDTTSDVGTFLKDKKTVFEF